MHGKGNLDAQKRLRNPLLFLFLSVFSRPVVLEKFYGRAGSSCVGVGRSQNSEGGKSFSAGCSCNPKRVGGQSISFSLCLFSHHLVLDEDVVVEMPNRAG